MLDDQMNVMALATAVWWVVFFGAVGLCVGSFLNVIIYRIPRDISVRSPLWSCCPGCGVRIRWYDNLPVIGYLRLGGRCRDCGMAISPRYPIVEMLCALVVLLILDSFFIAQSRWGPQPAVITVTWLLSEHWPIFLAHVILFAGLIAMSAIDLEHYWVDVRFTTFITIVGFAAHAVWTPSAGSVAQHPSGASGLAALAGTGTLLLTLCTLRWLFPPVPQELETQAHDAEPTDAGSIDHANSDVEDAVPAGRAGCEPSTENVEPQPRVFDPYADAGELAEEPGGPESHAPPAAQRLGQLCLAGAIGIALLVLAVLAILAESHVGPTTSMHVRWAPALVMLLATVLIAGACPREADVEIIQAIESERGTARQAVSQEFLCLLPTMLVGAAVLWWGSGSPETGERFGQWLDWRAAGRWQPMQGLATAATGLLIGGGIGWAVRILATLAMGKETFGTGDIHMMAAAGCVAGWPVVLIGFVLCSFLALAGWILVLPFKRTRAIPLGPWLSISFLLTVLFYRPIIELPLIQNVVYLFQGPLVESWGFTPSQ